MGTDEEGMRRMYCSNCGVKAGGNFCFQCGYRLQHEGVVAFEDLVPAVLSWEDDADYERIAKHPEVRTVIASHAAQARPGLSAEALMEIADKVVPIGISYSAVAAVAQPMWASLGVRTGKQRSAVMTVPIGRAIARVLCSLAKNQQAVQRVEQEADGCTIQAELPSSIWAMKGVLTVKLMRQDNGCVITVATDIPGQAFDWGMSQRCLDTLLLEVQEDLGLPPAEPRSQAA
ncbi:hypothetical protein C5Y96_03910 [Blastopirellula marina]|uniref:Uncharacterized protein n=2 Tax=Pirellulales TaxID=2691354 RepID=A0A2S8G405_9BACT|nr:hypothetical protein C5Y96_03910 [Blastopirellula marina]RCS55328.1 hypothetical protein DTL36_03915 [Bremerella cremea]